MLTALGYEPGSTEDGSWNERLSTAYLAFLRDVAFPPSKVLTPLGLRRLREVAQSEGVAGAWASNETVPTQDSDRLHRAVIAGDIEGVRTHLSGGAPVDGRDGQGWTPLMHAANKGYVLLVEMLLRSGASPDVRAADGATALFIATINAHPEAIALLMRAGASVSIRGPRGLTAVDVARLVYGEKKEQRPVPDDAEVHALLAGMTWAEAIKETVAGLRAKQQADPPESRPQQGAERQDVEQEVSLAAPSTVDTEAVEAALALTHEQRVSVQKALSDLGFDVGSADGLFGQRTRSAIREWQLSRGGNSTGYLHSDEVKMLLAEEEATARLAEEAARKRAAEEAEWKRLAEEAARKRETMRPGRAFRDCPDCPEMVVVPAGSFMMGSPMSEQDRISNEGPRHRVTIPEPFAVGKYEVTFSEWDACVAAGGCNGHRPDDAGWGRGQRPVINVNWQDAKAFVAWLSRRTGERYRLLSEAEWEYAARAGTSTRYWWGNEVGRAARRKNVRKTVPVGSYSPNPFGLHDVHGNVARNIF